MERMEEKQGGKEERGEGVKGGIKGERKGRGGGGGRIIEKTVLKITLIVSV